MTPYQLIEELENSGMTITVDDGALRVTGDTDRMTADQAGQIKAMKPEMNSILIKRYEDEERAAIQAEGDPGMFAIAKSVGDDFLKMATEDWLAYFLRRIAKFETALQADEFIQQVGKDLINHEVMWPIVGQLLQAAASRKNQILDC